MNRWSICVALSWLLTVKLMLMHELDFVWCSNLQPFIIKVKQTCVILWKSTCCFCFTLALVEVSSRLIIIEWMNNYESLMCGHKSSLVKLFFNLSLWLRFKSFESSSNVPTKTCFINHLSAFFLHHMHSV